MGYEAMFNCRMEFELKEKLQSSGKFAQVKRSGDLNFGSKNDVLHVPLVNFKYEGPSDLFFSFNQIARSDEPDNELSGLNQVMKGLASRVA